MELQTTQDGYLHDDILKVLGRSSHTSDRNTVVLGDPTYGRIGEDNFQESSEEDSDIDSEGSVDTLDKEWEDAKQLLYTTFVGILVPVVFRYIGRRATFSVWTRFLTYYFSR